MKTILPRYARRIFELMFAERAPFATTHLLMREYTLRTIELASLHNPDLFSHEEIERCKPPFTGGLREWGERETPEEELHGIDSPFQMDFENYTIGSLVPGRNNYDFKHGEYRKVRAKILWRVEQLGWSSERFKNIDSSIARGHGFDRMGSHARKTDRYGKKYSWIAFFEMSGFLRDQGVSIDWRERTSSVDIDPSFPERVIKGHLINADFLGNPEIDMKDWIANGPLPDVEPNLRLGEVQNEVGPWILLDGFAIQQDEARGRKSFCFIRSFILAKRDADTFLNHLSHQDLGGRWLPEKPSVIYTFAGEIPWCNTFPSNGPTEISFITSEKTVKVQRIQQELYLDGKKLGWTQIDLIQRRLFGDAIGGTEKLPHISNEDLKRIEIREEPAEVEELENEYAAYNVLIPVCNFGWEGYHTAASDAGHATTLAKEITSDLDIIGQPQSFDLFTKDGVKATFNVSDQSSDYNNNQKMFFIRESLLKTYIEKNDLALIWAIWGEREYSSDQVEKLFHGPNHPEQSHAVFSFVKCYD